MAADAHLLDLAEAGDAGPAVRLYGWDRPSITIGHHQKLERAVDVARLGDTPVVRRITGGRALLHDDTEITYAVAGNFVKYPALGTTLHESYRVIADAIVRFYAGCGMGAYISRREDPLARSGLPDVQKGCFASVSRYEIMVGGRKIAAGSQRRTRQAFMQHGVIRIATARSHPAIVDAAPGAGIMPAPCERKDLEQRLAESFSNSLGGQATVTCFSDEDIAAIESKARDFGNLNQCKLSLNSEKD
jgi:lipoate-protein ligase A